MIGAASHGTRIAGHTQGTVLGATAPGCTGSALIPRNALLALYGGGSAASRAEDTRWASRPSTSWACSLASGEHSGVAAGRGDQQQRIAAIQHPGAAGQLQPAPGHPTHHVHRRS